MPLHPAEKNKNITFDSHSTLFSKPNKAPSLLLTQTALKENVVVGVKDTLLAFNHTEV